MLCGAMITAMDREVAIRRMIIEAVEEAGMSGLCREGQRELALGRILSAMPDLGSGPINYLAMCFMD